MNKYNWNEIQKFYNEIGNSWRDVVKKFGCCNATIRKAQVAGKFKSKDRLTSQSEKYKITGHPKHTDETKDIMSQKRIKWMQENPDKHPWKRPGKFDSVPCNTLKAALTETGISFVPEYTPDVTRGYAVDIAFPDKKIALEVNGNQHYNSDKTLKPYYIKRQQHLESLGWKVYNIHYSLVFDTAFTLDLISKLKADYTLSECDYSFYIKQPVQVFCSECGVAIWKSSTRCRICSVKCLSQTDAWKKFNPTKEELETLIKNKSYLEIGRLFNVSDNAIKKRAILLGIDLPKREPGYWAKKKALDSKD